MNVPEEDAMSAEKMVEPIRAARQAVGLYYELAGSLDMAEAVRSDGWERFSSDGERILIQAFKTAIVTARKECAAVLVASGNVPDGWKLVPIEPTEAMLNACWRHTQSVAADTRMLHELMSPMLAHKSKAKGRYKAMLAAAPEADHAD